MPRVSEKNLYRILDANFNRTKEGLRVCEDLCRFVWNEKKCTLKFKNIRHRVTALMAGLGLKEIIKARNIVGDVGKRSIASESKRAKVQDILYANLQRIKESIRVLEEFSKLISSKLSQDFKRIRYQVYALEKEIISRR